MLYIGGPEKLMVVVTMEYDLPGGCAGIVASQGLDRYWPRESLLVWSMVPFDNTEIARKLAVFLCYERYVDG